eukprot:Awhi_evm1s11877
MMSSKKADHQQISTLLENGMTIDVVLLGVKSVRDTKMSTLFETIITLQDEYEALDELDRTINELRICFEWGKRKKLTLRDRYKGCKTMNESLDLDVGISRLYLAEDSNICCVVVDGLCFVFCNDVDDDGCKNLFEFIVALRNFLKLYTPTVLESDLLKKDREAETLSRAREEIQEKLLLEKLEKEKSAANTIVFGCQICRQDSVDSKGSLRSLARKSYQSNCTHQADGKIPIANDGRHIYQQHYSKRTSVIIDKKMESELPVLSEKSSTLRKSRSKNRLMSSEKTGKSAITGKSSSLMF